MQALVCGYRPLLRSLPSLGTTICGKACCTTKPRPGSNDTSPPKPAKTNACTPFPMFAQPRAPISPYVHGPRDKSVAHGREHQFPHVRTTRICPRHHSAWPRLDSIASSQGVTRRGDEATIVANGQWHPEHLWESQHARKHADMEPTAPTRCGEHAFAFGQALKRQARNRPIQGRDP